MPTLTLKTNPKTLRAGILTRNDRHDAFERFCAPVFCDFIRNYFLSDSETFELLDTWYIKTCTFNIISFPGVLCNGLDRRIAWSFGGFLECQTQFPSSKSQTLQTHRSALK